MVWNSQHRVCVCADGFYWSGYACLPLPTCDNGQIWNKGLQKCVCGYNKHWNGKECVYCGDGAVWDQ